MTGQHAPAPAQGPGGPAGPLPWWGVRPPPLVPPISARRAYAEVLGVYAAFFAASVIAGAEALAGRYPAPSGSWATFLPLAVGQLATAGLAVLVAVLLSARRGVTPRVLGLGLPRKAGGTVAAGQAFRAGVWAVAALLAGGLITAAVTSSRLPQPARQDAAYVGYTIAASVAAGVAEETLALAFLVTTLRQARRPAAEIVLVAALLRCGYHDYYGLGVIGIAVWAAAFTWLFLRTGSVIPLVVVHVLWDATIFLGQQPALRAGLALGRLAAYVLLPLLGGLTLLVEKGNGPRAGLPAGGGMRAGPGHWPDPPGPPGQA